jgi:hypothetical protein
VREAIRVAKAQVDVRLGGKVEDGVDVVALHAVEHLGRVGNVAVEKGKVALIIEDTRVVERRAVVELVERDNVVCIRVREREVADQPTGTYD